MADVDELVSSEPCGLRTGEVEKKEKHREEVSSEPCGLRTNLGGNLSRSSIPFHLNRVG